MSRMKRLLAIIITAVVAVCLTACQESNEAKYNRAGKLLSEGKYEEAVKLFEEISTYEDSSKMAMYAKAISAAEKGNYSLAVSGFQSLGDFKDSSFMITYYSARQYESKAEKEGDFNSSVEAAILYESIPFFLDSAERAEKCRAWNKEMSTAVVPSVTGLIVSDAKRLLDNEGLFYKALYVDSDDVDVDIVMYQNPEADTVVRKGDTVLISVSSGPSDLTMPDVVGMNIENAKSLLQSYGLTQLTLYPVLNGDYPIGTVVSQEPAANDKADKETPVSISYSGGKTTVPLLKNLTLTEAEEILRLNQLRINPVLTYVDTRNAKEHGKITAQSPAENLDVMLDSEVLLSIYRYPTDKTEYSFDVTLNKSDTEIGLLVTLQADDSMLELTGFAHTYPPEEERIQKVTVIIPDKRRYICRVYQDGEVCDLFEIWMR